VSCSTRLALPSSIGSVNSSSSEWNKSFGGIGKTVSIGVLAF
jgi:hypothetical protein